MKCLQVGKELPLVSVVVPAAGRSPWLGQAVRSVLEQSYRNCEVLIVDDSPAGVAAAAVISDAECDPRVRVVRSGGVGGASARNMGVRAARGKWIAFLDDDDEWMPEKLERQMEIAVRVCSRFPVVSCRVRVKTPRSEYIFPRHVYRGRESVAEYLFCRRRWAHGSGFMQTSTLLAPRELLLQVPFSAGLPMHQDWDWLLRASREPGVSVQMLEDPLAIYRTEDGRETVSRNADWRLSLDWIRDHAETVGPETFSWFVAVQCVWKARASGACWQDWLEIACAFGLEGWPTLRSAAYFAGFALVPASWRKGIRNRVWGTPRILQARVASAQVRSNGWKLVSRQKAL